MKIADKLRKQREKKGYSQESMALSIGISYGTYHNLEKGRTDIKFSILEKCAEIFEIHLIELLPDDYITSYRNIIEAEEKDNITSS